MLVATSLIGALAAAPLYAHHSFAMFDTTIQKDLHGTVKDFQWTNPHIWIELETLDEKGNPIQWSIEGNSPSVLSRQNWTKHTLKVGDTIVITINPLKDGRNGGDLVKIVTADGTVIGNGSKPADVASK